MATTADAPTAQIQQMKDVIKSKVLSLADPSVSLAMKRTANRTPKPRLTARDRGQTEDEHRNGKGASPPTPPMSSPESSSPPPGPQNERGSSSPDIIPHEVLQGISKIALVKNFNRPLADDEIKERRQNNRIVHGLEHLKRADLRNGVTRKGSTSPSNSLDIDAAAVRYDDADVIENTPRIKKSSGKPSDLCELDEYQRRIEQENYERKLVLAQAVQERERRTTAEVHRLSRIKAELAKLDLILSSDVAILRKEIEAASIDFNEAEKNYVRIEKDFIEAKMILHQKLDRKEKLTEHLCFIVEENEIRKAKKLEQLMEELNGDATPRQDDYEMLSSFERDRCTSCGGSTEEVDVFETDRDASDGTDLSCTSGYESRMSKLD